ncbi:MAG TPA: hypothetical protein VFP35_02185 [Candidatus Saccharimonadales bacterium]|nr:hypothetical protein [Candidatus Saccharimonadales bacterium]
MAAVGSNCDPNTANSAHHFFGFPTWWEYISTGNKDILGKCVPRVNFPEGAWAIGLAVLDMLLYLAGIVAVISIIVAGFEYLFTQGNSEKGVSARKRVVNSLIGLAMVLIAGGLVSFIGNKL